MGDASLKFNEFLTTKIETETCTDTETKTWADTEADLYYNLDEVTHDHTLYRLPQGEPSKHDPMDEERYPCEGKLPWEEAGGLAPDFLDESEELLFGVGVEKPSQKKAPEKKLNRLQRKHQNAELGQSEMLVHVNDVMELLKHLALVENLYTAYKHSHRGAAIAGTTTLVGGLLGGPPGIFIGATLGGLIGWMTSKQFKSVPQILMELPAAEKQKLCAEATALVKNLQWKDAKELIRLVMKNPAIRDKVVGMLNDYLTKKLKAQIRHGK